jgi:hypothetical protein
VKLASVTGGSTIIFFNNNLGHTYYMMEVGNGMTVYAGATYSPQGFLYGKTDWVVDNGVTTYGDTLVLAFTPSAEMVGKHNLSTGITRLFGYDLAS